MEKLNTFPDKNTEVTRPVDTKLPILTCLIHEVAQS